MSITTSQVGNLRITTQVVNASDTADSDEPQFITTLTPMTSKYFKKIPAKALSAVLMLIGILQLCMGIVFYATETTIVSLTLTSGVYIWGGLVVFVAGGACLTAILTDTINMVKVCLSCSITNIVVAAVGLILFVIQTYYETQICWTYRGDSEIAQCSAEFNYYHLDSSVIVNLRVSMNIMIMFFSLLGLVISSFMAVVSDKVLKIAGYSLLK